jgi:hypothetical protein
LLLLAATMACTGPEGPAGPAGPSGSIGSPIVVTTAGTGSLVMDETALTYTQIPGLSATVTVPAGSTYKALIETDGGVQLNSDNPAAFCFADVALFVDGTQVGSSRRLQVSNTASVLYSVGTYGLSVQTNLPAGTHTVAAMAKTFVSIVIPCYVSSAATGSGLPGNPRLQGVLNVVAFP